MAKMAKLRRADNGWRTSVSCVDRENRQGRGVGKGGRRAKASYQATALVQPLLDKNAREAGRLPERQSLGHADRLLSHFPSPCLFVRREFLGIPPMQARI